MREEGAYEVYSTKRTVQGMCGTHHRGAKAGSLCLGRVGGRVGGPFIQASIPHQASIPQGRNAHQDRKANLRSHGSPYLAILSSSRELSIDLINILRRRTLQPSTPCSMPHRSSRHKQHRQYALNFVDEKHVWNASNRMSELAVPHLLGGPTPGSFMRLNRDHE